MSFPKLKRVKIFSRTHDFDSYWQEQIRIETLSRAKWERALIRKLKEHLDGCEVCGKDSEVATGFHLKNGRTEALMNFCGQSCIADFVETRLARDAKLREIILRLKDFVNPSLIQDCDEALSLLEAKTCNERILFCLQETN